MPLTYNVYILLTMWHLRNIFTPLLLILIVLKFMQKWLKKHIKLKMKFSYSLVPVQWIYFMIDFFQFFGEYLLNLLIIETLW